MKTIPISESTLNAIIQYLASCPFAQVEPLIQAVRIEVETGRQIEREKKPEKPIKTDKPDDKEIGGEHG